MKIEIKEMDKLIHEPYLHIAGRVHMRDLPIESHQPRALTEDVAIDLISYMEKDLTMQFGTGSQRYYYEKDDDRHPSIIRLESKLEDYSYRSFDKGRLAGELCLKFRAKELGILQMSEFLDKSDKYLDSKEAFERRMAHWGHERWGGLLMDISGDKQELFTKVDLFAPKDLEDLSSEFYVSLYLSRKEESKYKKL